MKETPTPAEAARTIVRAVNAKDADLYASVCAEDVIVQIYDGPVRMTGRRMLQENRSRHFARRLRIPRAKVLGCFASVCA